MNQRTRRIIMFTFIAAFFILAPVLLFYSSGYRYDLKRHKIIKTGTLMVEAKEIRDGKLFINNKEQEETFNKKMFIYNMLPGEYNVKLIKDGYHPWQKKIRIHSGITTFAKDTFLFKDSKPEQIIDSPIKSFYLSPNNLNIIYLSQSESFLDFYNYNLKNQESTLIYRSSQINMPIDLNWANSDYIFSVKIKNNYLLFDLTDPDNIVELKNIVNKTVLNIKWDPKDNNQLYYLTSQGIFKLNINQQSSENIINLSSEVNPEFFIDNNDLFYIQRDENKNYIYKYNLNFGTNKQVTEITKSTNYKFIKSDNNYLNLIDLDLSKLFLIKKIVTDFEININANDPIQELKALNADWDSEQQKILIYDDFELSFYDTQTNYQTFINRYGQEIKKAVWYPKLTNIVILFDDRIDIIDVFQENGSRNIIRLVDADINDMYLSKDAKTIYFNGLKDKQGLYQLNIR